MQRPIDIGDNTVVVVVGVVVVGVVPVAVSSPCINAPYKRAISWMTLRVSGRAT